MRKPLETVKTTFQNPNGVTVAWIRNQSQTRVTWGSPEFHFRRVAATVGGMDEFQGFTPLAIHSRPVGTKTGRHPRLGDHGVTMIRATKVFERATKQRIIPESF